MGPPFANPQPTMPNVWLAYMHVYSYNCPTLLKGVCSQKLKNKKKARNFFGSLGSLELLQFKKLKTCGT